MNKEKIFSKFLHGDIQKDTPYAEELGVLHAEFTRRCEGRGCQACRRRNATNAMKPKVVDLLSKYEE